MRLVLSTGPKRICVSLPSLEDGNRSRFRNVMFYSYLEYREMDEVQKPNDSMKKNGTTEEVVLGLCGRKM
jgi:hypothetical protein